MKLAFLTTLALPVASSASSESYLRKAIHQLFAAEQLANIGTTPCTYFSVDNDEGCGTDDMCKISTGHCMLRSASQEGVCITPPEICTAEWDPVCGCDGVSYSNECDALSSGVNVMNVGCCTDDEDCEDNIEDSFTSADEATTPCTYFSVDNDEGCGTDDMCKIATGNCMLRSASQEGVCITPPEMCTYDFNPVCGCDGVSYSNECDALGAGVNVMNVGCCPDDEDCEDNIEDSFTSADETITPCTYFNVKDDEGCGADDMCKIAMGHCMAIFMVASLEGVCITPPERCTYNFDPVCGCDNVTYGNECSAFGAGVNIQFPGCCLNDEECQIKLA